MKNCRISCFLYHVWHCSRISANFSRVLYNFFQSFAQFSQIFRNFFAIFDQVSAFFTRLCPFYTQFSMILNFFARFSKSYCQRKPDYYSLSKNAGWGKGYQQNLFCGPGKPKRQFLAMSDIYFYLFFYLFLPRTLNSFSLFDTDQNRSNWINLLSLAVD